MSQGSGGRGGEGLQEAGFVETWPPRPPSSAREVLDADPDCRPTYLLCERCQVTQFLCPSVSSSVGWGCAHLPTGRVRIHWAPGVQVLPGHGGAWGAVEAEAAPPTAGRSCGPEERGPVGTWCPTLGAGTAVGANARPGAGLSARASPWLQALAHVALGVTQCTGWGLAEGDGRPAATPLLCP